MKDKVKRYKKLLEAFDLKYVAQRKIAIQDLRYTLDEVEKIASENLAEGEALNYALSPPSFKRKCKCIFLEFLILQTINN